MVASKEGESARTTVQRKSEREVVVTRMFDAPARLVFEAWSKPELFRKWWVPRSMGMTLRSCEMDVRTGGGYRLVFGDGPEHTMAFFEPPRVSRRLPGSRHAAPGNLVAAFPVKPRAGCRARKACGRIGPSSFIVPSR